eukprot:CAMPEP_0115486430 /NCGR_PEP_ID=MMETSP0271-20121206/60429_1 /TAXON_ID=71861 /ORGANISM="Scrippsiella trochoidea, Strain CCMP3099" /LENGTH=33 /DNA_ID= /DNA_START= /DNA_END= /DNA_ORIENTATION=
MAADLAAASGGWEASEHAAETRAVRALSQNGYG